VGVADRRREDARRRQPGDVRDVGQQVSAHFVGDGAEGRPVRRVGVRGEAGDDDFGAVLAGQVTNLVVVEQLSLQVHAVADHVVDAPAAVDRAAVRQVTAVQQVHAHQRVARLDQRAVDGAVGRRPAERLHVDPQIVRANRLGSEQFGGAAAGQALDDVGELGALVIARVGVAPVFGQAHVHRQNLVLAEGSPCVVRVPFGVEVVEGRADRLAHRHRHAGLGRDEVQAANLAQRLQINQRGHVWIEVGQAAPEKKVVHSNSCVSTNGPIMGHILTRAPRPHYCRTAGPAHPHGNAPPEVARRRRAAQWVTRDSNP